MKTMKVVIIGGVAGGATAAARLRRLDEHAQIVVLERGGYVSFANCGLPYYIGGTISRRDDLLLQTPQSFKQRFNIDVRVQSEVLAINREAQSVTVRDLQSGHTYEEPYDALVLSPGAHPVRPDVPGMDLPGVFTLRDIADTDAIKGYIDEHHPRRAAIQGGGYIGVEMAENLVHAGVKTCIIQRSGQLIAPLDPEMAAEVHRHLRERGVELCFNNSVERVAVAGATSGAAGGAAAGGLELTLRDGQTTTVDLLVVATGVKPENQLAIAAGLEVGERGGIKVDEHMRTADPHIYAVGDAVEVTDAVTGLPAQIPLAGPANRQGRIAADNICGIPSTYKGTQGSAILKAFDLTAAATGLNEKTAKRIGIPYSKVYTYSANHAGYYPGGTMLSIKTLFDPATGRILGAQVVGGEGADKRADVLAVAIRAKMTADDLTELELHYAPPFSSAKDPVNMAGYVIQNVVTGKVRQFFFDEVAGLPRDGSVTLLDVRTNTERASGHIEGFRHIPLDDLRGRLDELDRGKPVYVHCHSGLRSYIAARLLTAHGFEVYNLAGGYRLYQLATA